jgi:hypothetical protein
MESNVYPLIKSFVIRFVIDEPSSPEETKSCYRGTIRHIQSNEEINFNNWEAAVKFIRRYVPLETEPGHDSV